MATNSERAFSERPEVYAAWVELNGAIKTGMDLRRYELATLAPARRLRSSYCALAHGTVLLERFDEPVRKIALDRRAAGLDEVDFAVMDLAASSTTRPRSPMRTCSVCATSASPTPRSWTSSSRPPHGASFRRRSMP